MNTFDDDNDLGIFDEPRRRPPRETARRRERSGPRRPAQPPASNTVLRLAGLVVLGIAIVVGLVLSCSGQSKADYSSYIAAMQPLARDSASVGTQFANALGTSGLTMDTLQSELTSWSQQELNYELAAQKLQPPGLLQSAHAEAVATFHMRALALSYLAGTLKSAQEKHESAATAGAALASEAQLLSASDVLWEQLYRGPVTAILTAQNVGNVIVPGSRIVTNPAIVDPHQLATVYQRVRTPTHGGKVVGRHGSALIETIAVEGGKSTQLSTTSGRTIFVGSDLVINVVVEDSGSYPEVQIPVTLTVKAGSQSVYTETKNIAQIAAGEQQTVSFTNLQLPPSTLSNNATISVHITKVNGEAKLDNNDATYPVFFRLAPPA